MRTSRPRQRPTMLQLMAAVAFAAWACLLAVGMYGELVPYGKHLAWLGGFITFGWSMVLASLALTFTPSGPSRRHAIGVILLIPVALVAGCSTCGIVPTWLAAVRYEGPPEYLKSWRWGTFWINLLFAVGFGVLALRRLRSVLTASCPRCSRNSLIREDVSGFGPATSRRTRWSCLECRATYLDTSSGLVLVGREDRRATEGEPGIAPKDQVSEVGP